MTKTMIDPEKCFKKWQYPDIHCDTCTIDKNCCSGPASVLDQDSCPEGWFYPQLHCNHCEYEGCQDGRDLEVVNQYASTCDGCYELTMHKDMEMDGKTQLGYCPKCMAPDLFDEVYNG